MDAPLIIRAPVCGLGAVLAVVLAAGPGHSAGVTPPPDGPAPASFTRIASVEIPIAENGAIARARPVINALRQQGYDIVSLGTTWLNRVRIRARNAYVLREIIVSPASGDILRDAVVRQYRKPPATKPEDRTFKPILPGGPGFARGQGDGGP